MRIPFLRPKPEAVPAKPSRVRNKTSVDETEDIESARTRARRRLVGALVLLLIGVLGFPVLFETQPRPLPMNTPLEALRRDTAASGTVSTESAAGRQVMGSLSPADAGTEVPPLSSKSSASAASVSSAAAASAAVAKAIPVSASAPKAVVTPPAAALAGVKVAAATPTPSKPATPATPVTPGLPTKSAVVAPPAGASGTQASQRFVVQAGAYSDATKLREARSKIERLGLKTYTQVIDSDKGSRTRVRVGPFESRAEAEAVAEKIKRVGVPSAILTL